VTLGLRPERLAVVDAPDAATLRGEVTLAEHLGGETVLHLAGPQGRVIVKCAGSFERALGETTHVRMDLAGATLFDAQGLRLD
jgi:multiple sugar transport system ATP-binding protein